MVQVDTVSRRLRAGGLCEAEDNLCIPIIGFSIFPSGLYPPTFLSESKSHDCWATGQP